MADFYSYIPTLAKYLRLHEPKRILEWGTGESTKIMNQLCPNAEIHSIEHSKQYFEEYKNIGKGKKQIHIYHVPIADGYSSYPLLLGGFFDFIFVDGLDEQRPNCLLTAFDVLKDSGVVLLHDSERENYRNAVSKFKVLEEQNGTAVMQK